MKMYWIRPLAILALAVLPLGCQEKEAPPPASPGSPTVATTAPTTAPTPPGSGTAGLDTAAGAAASGGGRMMGGSAAGGAPMMSGGAKKMTLAEATAEAPKDDATLAPLADAYTKAEAKLKKAPGDAAAKKAFVDAAYKFGYAAEYKAQLSNPVKYRAALYLYRKALAVDPQHAESVKERTQIEQIYATMPGGVPHD